MINMQNMTPESMKAFEQKYSSASKLGKAGLHMSHPMLAITARMHEKMRNASIESVQSGEIVAKKDMNKLIFDTSSAGIFKMAKAGENLELNPAFKSMLGYGASDDLSNVSFKDFFKSGVEYNTLIMSLITHGNVTNFHAILAMADGSDIHVMISATLTDCNSMLGTIVDITGNYESNLALMEAKMEVESLNNRLLGLFQRISHDLRSPFTGILGAAQQLRDDKEMSEEDRNMFIDMVYDSSHITYNFVSKLLEWAKVSIEGTKFARENVLLSAHVSSSLALSASNAAAKGINLACNVSPGIRVFADSDMLDLILNNLVSNSVKYTPDGGEISVSAVPFGNSLVRIEVRDNGIGMDEETGKSLFSMGVKSRQGTNGEPGTGLGLAAVYEAVKKHNGDIWVESEPRMGTAFIFTLQMAKMAPVEEEILAETRMR